MSQPASPIASPETPPGRLRRLRWVAVPFRRFGQWFAHQPRVLRISLIAVTLTGLLAGVIYSRVYLNRRATERATAAAWREFQDAATKSDLDAMRLALDHVSVANPADTMHARYREMIDRGEAEADFPEIAIALLLNHLNHDRVTEAAREAAKVLTKYPKNWQARCALARHAIQIQRDPALAEQHLAQLPSPDDPEADVRLAGLRYSLRLFEFLGRDTSKLRQVILRRLVPLTRSAAAANARAGEKVLLVSCYLEPFADPGALTELGGFWANADKLAEDALTESMANGDLTVLVGIAELGPRMRVALAMLRDNDPARLPPDRFQSLLKAIDDRTRRAWLFVRERTPQRPEVYRGLTLLALQSNDAGEAVRTLLDGLAACGDRPEFLELLVILVARFESEQAFHTLAEAVWQSAEAAKTDPVKWCLAAEVAFVLRRTDAAFAACAEARKIRPNHPWACATQARLLAREGKFLDAREALIPLGETAIRLNPALVRLHARILVGSGLWVLRDEEFTKIAEAQANLKSKSQFPAVQFLVGVLDAPADAERAAWVAAKAELVLAADPDAPLAARIRAEALFRLADLSAAPHSEDPARPPVWNVARVNAALRAIADLSLNERANVEVITAVATLQLKGQGNASAALRTISPLLANEAMLDGRQLEVLGVVLAANDRAAEAVRVLERAIRFPPPSAGCLAALAIAYHKNRQPLEARVALTRAENTPNRSDREQAELIAAKILLQREKP